VEQLDAEGRRVAFRSQDVASNDDSCLLASLADNGAVGKGGGVADDTTWHPQIGDYAVNAKETLDFARRALRAQEDLQAAAEGAGAESNSSRKLRVMDE
ncbi:unnamed protein product, partial [Polarella glacialis]